MRLTKTPRTLAVAVALATALTLGACGGGDDKNGDNRSGNPFAQGNEQTQAPAPTEDSTPEETETIEPVEPTEPETSDFPTEPETDDTGFGDDDPGEYSSDDPLVQSLADSFITGAGPLGEALTKEQGTCVAQGMLNAVGTDGLAQLGLSGSSSSSGSPTMEREDAEALAEVMVDCEVFTTDTILGMSGTTLSDDQRACVDEALTDDLVRQLMTAIFMGEDPDEAVDQDAQNELKACGMSGVGS